MNLNLGTDFPTVLRLVYHPYSEPFKYSEQPDSERGVTKCPRPPRMVNTFIENNAKTERMKHLVVEQKRVHVRYGTAQ